jgi:putative serine protease PepD
MTDDAHPAAGADGSPEPPPDPWAAFAATPAPSTPEPEPSRPAAAPPVDPAEELRRPAWTPSSAGWGPAETAAYGWSAPAAPHTPRRDGHRRGIGAFVAGAVGLALVAGLVGGIGGYVLAERNDNESLNRPSASLGQAPSGTVERPPDSVAGIAASVLPTVVSIDVRASGRGGTGSGFVIDGQGYILTNNHVVEVAATSGRISVAFQDGTTAEAQIVGRSATYDLAVLKVEVDGLVVANLGNSDLVVVGDPVVAIGSPLGLEGTVTAGIVSATNRPVTAGGTDGDDRSYISALQTDAAINPGNSGGPLVDAAGAVIGINSAIATLGSGSEEATGSIGLGFSIPINQARRTAEQLIQTGRATYPIIGASLDAFYTGDGVRIADSTPGGQSGVTAGGPADQAGLVAGDVIVSIDGQRITSADELIVAIRSKAPGDTIEVRYQRGSEESATTVTLGEAEG